MRRSRSGVSNSTGVRPARMAIRIVHVSSTAAAVMFCQEKNPQASGFFTDRREHFIVQGSLIAAITALVVSGLLLVWFLDHPYENQSGSIKPDEMERQLVIVESEHRHVAVPCDEAGNPVGRPS